MLTQIGPRTQYYRNLLEVRQDRRATESLHEHMLRHHGGTRPSLRRGGWYLLTTADVDFRGHVKPATTVHRFMTSTGNDQQVREGRTLGFFGLDGYNGV
jgi:hypothetical protein